MRPGFPPPRGRRPRSRVDVGFAVWGAFCATLAVGMMSVLLWLVLTERAPAWILFCG